MRVIRLGLGVFGVAVAASVLAFGLLGFGVSNAQVGPGGGGRGGIFGEYKTVLAQKLGISVPQLEAAQKATRDQLIDQAVAAGKLTRAQGDALKSGQKPPRGTPGQGQGPNRGPGGMRGGLSALRDIMSQHETVLAQKLGITKDRLDAAQKATRDELVDRAVAAGKLTKAQGDAMKSGQRPSAGRPGTPGARIGPGGLGQLGDQLKAAAAALNSTPEEIQAALRNGQSLAEFAQSKGIDRASLRATIMGTVQNEVNAAVRDGKLTPQQGTQIIERTSQALDRLIDAKRPAPGSNRGPGRPGAPGLQRGPNQR